MNPRLTVLALSFLFCLSSVQASDAPKISQDFGWWMGAAVDHKFNRRLSVSLEQELRLNRNLSTVDFSFTQVGSEFSFRKNIKAGVSYRFIRKNMLDHWSRRHGFFADITWRHKIKPFELSFKTRLQGRMEDDFLSSDGASPDWFLRFKPAVQWNTGRRWTPFVSQETFLMLHATYQPFRNGTVTRFRYQAGIAYDFNRRHSVSAAYMLQRNRSPLSDEFIVLTGYAFSF